MLRVRVKLLVAIGDGFLLDLETIEPPIVMKTEREGRTIDLTIGSDCIKDRKVNAVWVEQTIDIAETLLPSICAGENMVRYRLPSQGGVPSDIDSAFRKIYTNSTWALNLLIGAFRATAHQYWVNEIPIEADYIGNFFHHVRIANIFVDDKQYNLAPAPYAFMNDTGRTVVNKQTLEKVTRLVNRGRVPLASELLANAERLLEQAHYRASIIEIGSAIEAIIHRFGDRADMSRLNAERLARLDMSFSRLVGDLGIRATVRVLLPLLIPEDILDEYALENIIKAIDLRNEVVHQGKRALDKEEIWDCLVSARELLDGLPLRDS